MSSQDEIRSLNDQLRRSQVGGKVMLSAGLVALFEKDLAAVVELVRAFDDFSEDNDPYGEHDFGAFEYQGQTINWKIDYHALDIQHGSENPANAAITKRVFSIRKEKQFNESVICRSPIASSGSDHLPT